MGIVLEELVVSVGRLTVAMGYGASCDSDQFGCLCDP